MRTLLESLGVISSQTSEIGSSSSPWFLAATVLTGGKKLAWKELWDVLRWYAHNRGYDGNRAWAANVSLEQEDDTEKVENAELF